jgi:hypothetical protein
VLRRILKTLSFSNLSKTINEEIVSSMIRGCFFFNGGELFERGGSQNLRKEKFETLNLTFDSLINPKAKSLKI